MTSANFTRVTDEDFAKAYGITQRYNLDEPPDSLINVILADLQGQKIPMATELQLNKMNSRHSIAFTAAEPPPSAGLTSSYAPSSPPVVMPSDDLHQEQLTSWGEDFSPRSSGSQTIEASPSSHTEKESSPNNEEMTNISDLEDKGFEDQYLMSGGLHPSDPHPYEVHTRVVLNDSSTHCPDSLSSLIHNQPFRVLDPDDIYHYIHEWFDDPEVIYRSIRDDFLTTVYGVQLSLEEINNHEAWDDDMLVAEIMFKGGMLREWKSVIYPEDIVPMVGEDNPWYEWEYWEKIREQGKLWAETGVLESALGDCDMDGINGDTSRTVSAGVVATAENEDNDSRDTAGWISWRFGWSGPSSVLLNAKIPALSVPASASIIEAQTWFDTHSSLCFTPQTRYKWSTREQISKAMSISAEPGVAMPMNPPYPLHPSVADKLSPQYVKYYNQYLLHAQQAHFQPVSASRVGGKIIPGGSQCLPVGRLQDFLIPRVDTPGPEVKIRCFIPYGDPPSKGWPVCLYYHGGGWVLGNIDTENPVCTNMCARANSVVITTDYRLAPEDPYPAAVHDSWEAVLWTISTGVQVLNLDLSRAAIGGASAGANLAAVITQKALLRPDVRGRVTFRAQLLVVPVTDNTATVQNNPTYKLYENTAALPAAKILWYRDHYLPDADTRTHSEASPLLFAGDFGQLPPGVILVGELDVLRHEGEEYARKLRAAGVEAKLEVMVGMPHPFLAMDAVLDEGKRAITILCETLIQAFQ